MSLAERWLYYEEPIAARGAGPRARRGVPGCESVAGRPLPVTIARVSENLSGRRVTGRSDPAGHSPIAVRAAETMTTGSEPALILSLRCQIALSLVLSATEVKLPSSLTGRAGGRGYGLQATPPHACAGRWAGLSPGVERDEDFLVWYRVGVMSPTEVCPARVGCGGSRDVGLEVDRLGVS